MATAQTERDWLALAQTLDMRAFERRVAGARVVQVSTDGAGGMTACAERAGEQRVRTHWLSPKTVRVSFELPAETWALVERALEGARRAGGTGFGDGQALEAVARDALSAQAEGGDASDPRRAIVLYECQSCGRSELETGVGALELDPARAASLGCGAPVCDLESEGRTVTRGGPLPAAVRGAVMLRDRCRCRVPGCTRRRYVDVHHLTAQAHGGEHSRRNCLTLCTPHHELLHDGKLTVAGNADRHLSFCDASGRPIVAAVSVATHLDTLGGDVGLHATHLEILRGVELQATEATPSIDAESSVTHDDLDAGDPDGVLHGRVQPGGPLAPTRLLELMGRRGGWTMDALIERGSSHADLAGVGRKGPKARWSIRPGVSAGPSLRR